MRNLVRWTRDWHRDLPDPRDYTPRHEEVVKNLIELRPQLDQPKSVDWREYCGGVEDQQSLRSSCAFCCAALLQYFERRATGRLIEPSTLFIYKTTRRLLGWAGDSGTHLRSTWKAILRFGTPTVEIWPYDPARFDDEPDAFAYSSAQRCTGLRYLRLDVRGQGGEKTLIRAKSYLAAGFPFVFGFPVSGALMTEAEIPVPTIYDRIQGGLAVMAVGYDDDRLFRSYRGALLIRNSWGGDWGEHGYGWLPYAYVREELAADLWTVFTPSWLASGEFLRPSSLASEM